VTSSPAYGNLALSPAAAIAAPYATEASASPRPASPRLASLDAYRGFVMVALMGEGFLNALGVDYFPHSRFWQAVGAQFRHVPWQGLTFWDLIQPSFMLLVGVAIPFSLASRRARGDTSLVIWTRILRRTLLFLVLGVIILSRRLTSTDFNFADDVLPQIGLSYPFACLAEGWPVGTQVLFVAAILGLDWAAFALHPVAGALPSGVPAGWHQYGGFFAHWNRFGNLGADVERSLRNLFPRSSPFDYDKAGLATLNFVPSIATLTFGVMAGQRLRAESAAAACRWLVAWGAALIGAGLLMGWTLCPIVKSIWTPSYTLLSGGCVFLILAAFVSTIEVWGARAWAFPLVVVGTNSLAMYLMLHLFAESLWRGVGRHLSWLPWLGEYAVVSALLWLTCYWMYRKRIVITI
jgi:predicted acyltransferase